MRTMQGRRVRSRILDGGRARRGAPPALARAAAPVCALALALWFAVARAQDPDPVAARSGFELARSAATGWAPDAYLIYVENDEPVGPTGLAGRWGYLFYSPELDQTRVYSVRSGKIAVAEKLDMDFEAPPVTADWIDSQAAVAAAEPHVARDFRQAAEAHLTAMLLMRGAFQDKDPDQTTWTLVYTSPGAPSLFVMVDAAGGNVRRTWRG